MISGPAEQSGRDIAATDADGARLQRVPVFVDGLTLVTNLHNGIVGLKRSDNSLDSMRMTPVVGVEGEHNVAG